MSDVIFIPDNEEKDRRILQQALAELTSAHPDAAIAERWDEMAQVTIKRFPGPPRPTSSPLDLSDIRYLDISEKDELKERLDQYLALYTQDVRNQFRRMHADIWQLQKRIAELESEEIAQLKL